MPSFDTSNQVGNTMWSFSRLKHGHNLESRTMSWKGPFSWSGYEMVNHLPSLPDIAGVYLFAFEYKDGFVLYAAGITNSTRRRFRTHTREFMKGNYTVLSVEAAILGEREEIWHGWNYAKSHPEEFLARKDTILSAVKEQLGAFRLFITEVEDKRLRERLEAALMMNIYLSKEPWAELADRGMHLKGRYNSEMPMVVENSSEYVIYGVPERLEI